MGDKKNVIIKLGIFVAGAAAGAFATYSVLKTKYDALLDERIDEIEARYEKRLDRMIQKYEEETLGEDQDECEEESTPVKTANAVKTEEKPNIVNYHRIIDNNGYTNYSDSEKDEDYERQSRIVRKDGETDSYPYVISPEELGDMDDYEVVSITAYNDGFLAYDGRNTILDTEEIELKIGKENLDRMGEYEEDAVHVRNDDEKIDYEIIRSYENYCDLFRR